jgi:uncharacterized protein YkwD
MRAQHLLIPMVAALLAGCGGGGNTTAPAGGGAGGGGTIGSGGAGSPVPVYILIGGNPSATVPAGADIFLDQEIPNDPVKGNRLRPGEIYIMAQGALLAGTTYTVAITANTTAETLTRTWSFTTGPDATPPNFSGTVIGELNALRGQSGASTLTANANYSVAAQRHAGYQCETSAISHNESNSSAQFFVNTDFFRRISIANGGTASSNSWGTLINTVYEDIATTAGVAAVDQLWNTVYHRIPMMRQEVSFIGNGDRSNAFTDSRNSPQVIASSGTGFQTIEFAAISSTPRTLAYWPTDNQTRIATSFNSNTESPDPFSTGNPNGAPNVGVVGPPITIIFPTSQDFTGVTVTLTQN